MIHYVGNYKKAFRLAKFQEGKLTFSSKITLDHSISLNL